MERENKKMREDSLAYVSNPLNAVLLIKRLSFDVMQMKSELTSLLDNFSYNVEEVRLYRRDWQGAVEGLVRLQSFYDLKSEDIAKGIIEDRKYNDDLTAIELFAIGDELTNMTSFKPALSYLNLALVKNRELPEMPQIVILDRISVGLNFTRNSEELVKTIDKMIELSPKSQDLRERKAAAESYVRLNVKPENAKQMTAVEREFKILSKVCNGSLKQKIEDISKLHCRFVSKSAFSMLAPFKMEEANLNPFIVLFHDVMSELEMQQFKSMSKPSLSRAEVLTKDAKSIVNFKIVRFEVPFLLKFYSQVKSIRVAKVSWNYDSFHEVFSRLTKRVGDMSGLRMEVAEPFQTQNYGIGGHYDGELSMQGTAVRLTWLLTPNARSAHFDFTTSDYAPFGGGTGNRIATMLFYVR